MHHYELDIAEQFALYTGKHLLITGSAGTGKTTLLKHIAAKTSKNFVVTAPTGVAAINAGGITIHSMFQLPVTAFVPSDDDVDINIATNQLLLPAYLKFNREKQLLIQGLELLIIDEISMVRCDIFDAIDFVLRTVRKNHEPFGGVQLIAIGDMYQLPPVVKNNEWEILRKYYDSPYFFDAHVWKSMNVAHVELKQIFRQSDERFLKLLDNIRYQRLTATDFQLLLSRYQPQFEVPGKGYILLTTHNRKADQVNNNKLNNLPGRMYRFDAEINGDFPEHLFPCDPVLKLKTGAQVMFIKNDLEEGKYFNGKLAVVKNLTENSINVAFSDTEEDFNVRKETWENISYVIDAPSGKIQKKIQGTFSQYPLRLAWAVTIHKSQGLTFDKVIVDAGQSFAPGQVYVALSRCRTLEGMVLHSIIRQDVLFGDERIASFSNSSHSLQELQHMLKIEQNIFMLKHIRQLFFFGKLVSFVNECKKMLLEKDFPEKETTMQIFENINQNLQTIHAASEKFCQKLEEILSDYQYDKDHKAALKRNCTEAIEYFIENIFVQVITPLDKHIHHMALRAHAKKHIQHLRVIQEICWNKINQLYEAKFLDDRLFCSEKKYSRNLLQ